MTNFKKQLNEGGVNGLGTGFVNVNSDEYKFLKKSILSHEDNLSPAERIKYDLIAIQYQMRKYLALDIVDEIKEAGAFLRMHLKLMGIKNKEFAQYIDLEESNLSAILKGKRKINADLARRLGELFNMKPNLWLRIQNHNEIQKLKRETSSNSKEYKLEDLLKKVS